MGVALLDDIALDGTRPYLIHSCRLCLQRIFADWVELDVSLLSIG